MGSMFEPHCEECGAEKARCRTGDGRVLCTICRNKEVQRIMVELPEPADVDHSQPHPPTDRELALAILYGEQIGVQPEEATFLERFSTTDAGWEERILDAEQAAKEAVPNEE